MPGNATRSIATPRTALLLAAALLPVTRAHAADPPEVDTSKWSCKFCPEDAGTTFTPNMGVGYVSDDSAKFGEYNGLDDKGAYVVADAEGRYRGAEGLWLDVSAVDLGLDARALDVEGGRQGRYALHFRYKQLPHHISDTTATPFLGAGSTALTLPANWATGATTGDLTTLDASLGAVDFDTERRIFDVGASLTPIRHWAFAVNVRHEEKTGTRGTGGSFIFNDSLLPMPVDYQTDQIDFSAAYNRDGFQARVAYYGSIFRNDDDALLWANPYLPLSTGGTQGQAALAPGNQFHQLAFSAGYRIADRTQLTAELALGRMSQDENFLPYTVNASLPTQPLPRSSLDGRVDTVSGTLRLTTALADELRINASLSYNDRDNRTPQELYDGIITDTAIAAPRTNLPYSFTRSVASIDGALTLPAGIRLYAGCSYDEYERSLQEVARTNEGSCWGKAGFNGGEFADVTLQYTRAERRGSHYGTTPGGTPLQNPLMRLYNLADRDRDELKLRADLTPGESFTLGFDARFTWDSYFESVIGLLEGNSWAVAADCAWAFGEKASATCFLGRERIDSRQANAQQLAAAPLWYGDNKDIVDSAGVGLKYSATEKFDLGIDYTYSRSTGEVTMESAVTGFPDLESRLNSARLYLNLAPRDKLSLRLEYWYEDYRSDDWALDGLAPATISNVLAFGQLSPVYDISVVTLSGRYEF